MRFFPRGAALVAAVYTFAVVGVLLVAMPDKTGPVTDETCVSEASSRAAAYVAHPLTPWLSAKQLVVEVQQLERAVDGDTCNDVLELIVMSTTGLELLRRHTWVAISALVLAFTGTLMASIGSPRFGGFTIFVALLYLVSARSWAAGLLLLPLALWALVSYRAWKRMLEREDTPGEGSVS
ncbi:MAG: hypothetical protein AAGN82_28635 [Myxococcota bacterium]